MFINLCMSEPFYIESQIFFYLIFFLGGGGGLAKYSVTFILRTKTCKPKIMKFVLDCIDK